MSEPYLRFGRHLRNLRLRLALSQRDLARNANLNQDTINRLEQLDSWELARPSTIRKLARALGIKPTDLTEL
jgi:transcriptional regulator with XRE-family HTH domain